MGEQGDNPKPNPNRFVIREGEWEGGQPPNGDICRQSLSEL